ncbi:MULTISPECIES: hypothetical protein [unclassified Modestobacter]
MSQPHPARTPVPAPPDQQPGWPVAGGWAGSPGPGSGWPGPPPAAPADRRAGPSLASAGVLALGIVLAAVLGALVVRSGAEDLGRGIGEGLVEASAAAMDDALSSYRDDHGTDGYGLDVLGSDDYGLDATQVEQSDPEAPDGLGEDPVLDGYAQECFGGDLPACDVLYQEAPLEPGYGEYGLTCGGRVEEYAVHSCSQLD